jgi:ABC-type transport system substrate-binding protein
MLTDWVDNSSVTFAKNQTYWAKDTGNVGKGNQLPYVDTVKFLIIADTNTMQSAFRTGRIDQLSADFRDGPTFISALPNAKYVQFPASGAPSCTVMRTDKAPFNDIRVRKALFKALDFPTISNALTGPGSVYLSYPIGYSLTYKAAYLSLDDADCPAEVKDIYTYDPAAAIQLLKDAGVTKLKGNIIVQNSTNVLNYYQTVQTYWAKAGIDVTIDPREQGAWAKIMQLRNYDFMMYGSFSPISNLHAATSMYGDSQTNGSYVNDPVVNAARDKMLALDVKDDPTADAIHRELMKYVLAQCWVIPQSGGVSYSLWWPWLKQFYGSRAGWGHINTENWVIWAWVDQTLKHSMGH